MERKTIVEVVKNLESLLQLLDNAYWEVSQIQQKDTLYDIISTIHIELNELAKLSIEDHYLHYEPITVGFRNCKEKLNSLYSNLPSWITRSTTFARLQEELPETVELLS